MQIEDLIKKYKKCNECGTFELKKDESINDIVKKNKVPNSYGIYIVYSIKNSSKDIIYIGKSGTIKQDGNFREQGIKQRLTKKQNNKPRKVFFQEDVIKKYKYDKLEFLWIITFDTENKEIPSTSEAKMIQAYYDQYKKLPLLNKEA